MEPSWHKLQQFLSDVAMFTRFSALGATIIMALLGAVSVTPAVSSRTAISPQQLVAIIGGAIAFHNFAYVLNDLVDLPLDRSEPRRAQFPLVRGSISHRQASFFILLQVLFAFAVTIWVGGGASAYLALAAAFFFMAIYDLWGKRCFLPPLTDLAQGIGWGCLALWAAALMPGNFSGMTWILFAYLTLFIILINGLHGGIRDLANDYKHGVRSTAILLGARPKGENVQAIPQRMVLYAAVLQIALIVLVFFPFPGDMLNYPPGKSLLTILALILLSFTSWRLLARARDVVTYRPQMLAVGTLHLIVTLGMLVALFLFLFPWWLQIIVLVIFLFPILTDRWMRNTLRWALSGKGVDALSASDFPLPDASQ